MMIQLIHIESDTKNEFKRQELELSCQELQVPSQTQQSFHLLTK